eukprot:14762008-Alexandrium_andersonii.AAC.1
MRPQAGSRGCPPPRSPCSPPGRPGAGVRLWLWAGSCVHGHRRRTQPFGVLAQVRPLPSELC